MSERTVKTQAELDKALADKVRYVYIDSPEGVWIRVGNYDRGSSHVEAWGSSHVVAWGSSHVVAAPYVAVHLHSARAEVEGGVVIDVTAVDQRNAEQWCHFQGLKIEDGYAVVYKAVDDNLASGRGLVYPLGKKVTVGAKGWKADGACGAGLHFGPTPRHARTYHETATRFLACRIPIKHASGIPGGTAKIKARECVVLFEVDIDGNALTPAEQVAS